jgi:hypothetical protein
MFCSFRKYMSAVLLAVFMAGCAHIPLPTVTLKPSKAETELVELNKQHEAKNAELEQKNAEFAKKMVDMEASFKVKFDSNLSLGAANLMAGYDTLIADPAKSKYALAAIPAFEVAITAFPQPTVKDYQQALSTQRKLLSDQATEIAKGKEEIAAAKAQATQTKADLDKITADKAKVEQEKADLAKAKLAEAETFGKETTRLAAEVTKQVNDAATLRAQQDAQKIANAESRKALEKWVVTILMIIGVVAGIIAFVIKGPTQMLNPMAALASAASIGLAIGVSFLPLGYLIGALALLFGLIVTVVILEWKKEKTVANGLAGAQAEYISQNPTSSLVTNVEEWVGGKESKIAKFIEDKQKQLNVK